MVVAKQNAVQLLWAGSRSVKSDSADRRESVSATAVRLFMKLTQTHPGAPDAGHDRALSIASLSSKSGVRP